MSRPVARVWDDPPAFALHDDPALATDSDELWLSYLQSSSRSSDSYTIIRYKHLIDHHLSPINDEGLGEHPYADAGLTWYQFQEIHDSPEAERWKALDAHHWVVTFKDVTLDVLAQECEVVVESVVGKSALGVLIAYLSDLGT